MTLTRRFLLAALLVMAVNGCSSTGYSTTTALAVPRTIKAPVNVHPEIAPYVPRFVALLQSNGFLIVRSDDPRALELRMDFDPNIFTMRVTAALWKDGAPVVSGSATNSGWGTLLARGSAVNNLADSSWQEFALALHSFVTRVTILPDNKQ